MRPQTSLSLLSTLLLLPIFSLADFTGTAEADGVKFDFKELKQRSAVVVVKEEPSETKKTYTINPNGEIEWEKDVDKANRCADGTQVCLVEWPWHDGKADPAPLHIIPIANAKSSKDSEPEYAILRDSDKKVLGLNVTLHGGEYAYGEEKFKQSAVVEFLCDEKEDGNGDDALKVVGYDRSTLRLEWKTKHACENALKDTPSGSKGSWGFFTWFIVIVFLAVAAYLIFGSWLNYNKYGARGWDLLPHSDTLRDLPYLIKDFLRRAVNTFQGSGGRVQL
ncbi:hypothetical protein TWF696_004949 [Orbilia brochopaga]|uniref:Autophagy-related protein 27 n=1 Tax=Orbilia brochopaga TaxID=3140254 RepID=A0AAV9UZ93_9PEZI